MVKYLILTPEEQKKVASLTESDFDRRFGWTNKEMELPHCERAYPIVERANYAMMCQSRYDEASREAIVRSFDGVWKVYQNVTIDEAFDSVCKLFAEEWRTKASQLT